MTITQDQGFSIVTAEPTDAPRMHAIACAAFASDAHTLMKVHEKGTAGVESELQPVEEIASYTTRPAKCTALKAVTPAGEILGWVCWGLWHYDGSHPALPEGEEDPRVRDPAPWLEKPAADAPPVEHMSYESSLHFATMQATRLSPLGVRTLYCISLHVDPAHQARGVGGALVRWATDKADADGVKVWVHASEAAYPLFAKHGFEVIETLPHELDKYATKPTPTGAPWGTYVIRYMVREPRSRA